jgi:hypothetical protein
MNNDDITALIAFLKIKKEENTSVKSNLSEFFGIWSKEEADEIEKIIADSCGKI